MTITIDDVEYALVPKGTVRKEFPIFKKNNIGEVFRFDDNNSGQWCLLSRPLFYEARTKFTYFCADNDDYWTDVPYDEERGLYDKQPVWCWDDEDTSMRNILFFDCKNNGKVFSYNGERHNWGILDNTEPVTTEQLQLMPFIWNMYLRLED